MNSKNTWFWLAVAAVLLVAILLHERFARPVAHPCPTYQRDVAIDRAGALRGAGAEHREPAGGAGAVDPRRPHHRARTPEPTRPRGRGGLRSEPIRHDSPWPGRDS